MVTQIAKLGKAVLMLSSHAQGPLECEDQDADISDSVNILKHIE